MELRREIGANRVIFIFIIYPNMSLPGLLVLVTKPYDNEPSEKELTKLIRQNARNIAKIIKDTKGEAKFSFWEGGVSKKQRVKKGKLYMTFSREAPF